jgi:hypothetical protein
MLVGAAGACVPELPCRLVLRGPEGTSLAIEPTAAVAVAVPPQPERSMTEAVVVVRGSDASVELVASRGGREVARRRVRLPLVPGGVAVDVARPVVEPGEDPGISFALLDDRAVAVDVFRDERWVLATSARDRLDLPSLAPGVYRVQVSRHLFAPGEPEPVGVGLFFVARAGGSRPALAELRQAVAALAPHAEVEDDPAAPDPSLEAVLARALLAPLGQTIVRTPDPAAVDGDARAAADRTRRRLRLLGALVCLGAGLGAAFLLVRRGFAAEREAARLHATEAPTPEWRDEAVAPVERPAGATHPSHELLAHGALVFLAFAAVALLLYVYGL